LFCFQSSSHCSVEQLEKLKHVITKESKPKQQQMHSHDTTHAWHTSECHCRACETVTSTQLPQQTVYLKKEKTKEVHL